MKNRVYSSLYLDDWRLIRTISPDKNYTKTNWITKRIRSLQFVYYVYLTSSYSCFPSSTNRSNRFLHVPLPPPSISPSKVYLISTEVNAFKRNISHRSPRRFDSSPIDLHSVSFNVVTKYALRVNLRNRKANKLIGSALNWVNVSSYQLVRMPKWRAISNRRWGHNNPWKL